MAFFRFFYVLFLPLIALPAMADERAQWPELRVLTHSSFALSKPLLEAFEQENKLKLIIMKAGDAGQMVNQLILTRKAPIADVVYGIDNTLIGKALAAGVLDLAKETPKQKGDPLLGAAPINYGFVALNIDKAWFLKQSLLPPRTLEDLTLPAYRHLLVVENPATSSPGLAFLLATIDAFGQEAAFAFWGKLRANGVKIAKGWAEAYRTDFTRNGGTRPIVVGYATSPAAEAFYSKDPKAPPPIENLFLRGGVFRQVEGAALIKGGKVPLLARQFIAFLQSPAVQKDISTHMWMYPILEETPKASVYQFATQPDFHHTPSSQAIGEHSGEWVKRWGRVVLR